MICGPTPRSARRACVPRAEERAKDWQRTLEDATEDARRELGVRAVRAQRTRDALGAMADEIQEREKDVKA